MALLCVVVGSANAGCDGVGVVCVRRLCLLVSSRTWMDGW